VHFCFKDWAAFSLLHLFGDHHADLRLICCTQLSQVIKPNLFVALFSAHHADLGPSVNFEDSWGGSVSGLSRPKLQH
jgi:hypothetical protein